MILMMDLTQKTEKQMCIRDRDKKEPGELIVLDSGREKDFIKEEENAAVSSSSLYQKKIWQRRWGKSHVS